MKRGCSSSSSDLTGGTGDVNPQTLQIIDEAAFANQTGSQATVRTFPNPVWEMNRASTLTCKSQKAFVMEVLKVSLYVDAPTFLAAAGGAVVGENHVSLSYDNAPAPALPAGSGNLQSFEWLLDGVRNVPQNNTNVLATASAGSWAANTPTGSPASDSNFGWVERDLTDEAGHGVIVGAPVFNLRQYTRYVLNAPGSAGEMMLGCRILYRIKGIPYDEWVRQFTFGI